MISFITKLKRSQRGQTLVELALLLPILIVLLMGTIEFGRIFFSYLTITHASREAVRATIVSTTKTDTFVSERVKASASWLQPNQLVVEVTPSSTSSRTSGVPLTVTVSYPVQLFTPILSDIMTNPFTVKAQTTMRIE